MQDSAIRANNGDLRQLQPAEGRPTPTPTPTPTIPPTPDKGLIGACAEAVEELRAARKTLEAKDTQIDRQRELLAIEQEITAKLKRINSLSTDEIAELHNALDAKDRVIAASEAEIARLKKKNGFWSKAKWFIIGGAAGVIAGSVLVNR